MKLTKEQRSALEQQLSTPYGDTVRLICDGREIALQVRCTGPLEYRVLTYIDGKFEGKWISDKPEAHPEQKFLRKSVLPLFSAKYKAAFEKSFGKRAAKADKQINATYTLYRPDWPSGKAAINHLCKVCDSVEIAPEKEAA